MAPVTGTYTFTTASDDGVRLYVNGQLLIDNWTDHGVVQNSGTASLADAVRSTTFGWTSTSTRMLATARLSWAYPGPDTQIVPQWALYPAPAGQSTAGGRSPAPTRRSRCPPARRSSGIARDDGLPSRRRLTTTWSKISGREDSAGGTVVFGNPNAPVTTATFGADGIYVLRLTVSDGAVTVSDDVTIIVNPAADDGYGHRPGRRLFQRPEQRIAFRHRRSRAARPHGQLQLGVRLACDRASRSTTSPCGGPARFSLLKPVITPSPRPPMTACACGSTGSSSSTTGSIRLRRRGRARRSRSSPERSTTSRWSTSSTAGSRPRGCCGPIPDRRRPRSRSRNSIRRPIERRR